VSDADVTKGVAAEKWPGSALPALGGAPISAPDAVPSALRPADGSAPSLAQVEALLAQIPDPEIPVVSIRDLGILRAVFWQDACWQVVITPTYSGCPAMGQIADDIAATLGAAGLPCRVLTQLAPAWTTDWINEATRQKLRDYGIAPPHTTLPAPSLQPVRLVPRRDASPAVACPRCGSERTTETSHFSSTACKALYKCLSCLEAFDYFKPY